jgi:hypothetical protein
MATIFWNGEPILYRRTSGGHGLIVGNRHYRFSANGDLQVLEELNDGLLQLALKRLHGDRAGLVYAANSETPHQRQLRLQRMAGGKKG